jgi:hypothetical protein
MGTVRSGYEAVVTGVCDTRWHSWLWFWFLLCGSVRIVRISLALLTEKLRFPITGEAAGVLRWVFNNPRTCALVRLSRSARLAHPSAGSRGISFRLSAEAGRLARDYEALSCQEVLSLSCCFSTCYLGVQGGQQALRFFLQPLSFRQDRLLGRSMRFYEEFKGKQSTQGRKGLDMGIIGTCIARKAHGGHPKTLRLAQKHHRERRRRLRCRPSSV